VAEKRVKSQSLSEQPLSEEQQPIAERQIRDSNQRPSILDCPYFTHTKAASKGGGPILKTLANDAAII
jgi:hypothetical protein